MTQSWFCKNTFSTDLLPFWTPPLRNYIFLPSLRHISGKYQANIRWFGTYRLKSQLYLRHIWGICQEYIKHIPSISESYIRYISGKYKVIISHIRIISGISQTYLWHVSGKSQVYLRCISGIPGTYQRLLSGICVNTLIPSWLIFNTFATLYLWFLYSFSSTSRHFLDTHKS